MGPLWDHVGVSISRFRGFDASKLCDLQIPGKRMTLDHLMATFQSLWIHLEYMKVLSQKTPIFPTYFNDFIKLFGGLWVDLGLIWDRFCHMRVNLGPLWGHFGATLGI